MGKLLNYGGTCVLRERRTEDEENWARVMELVQTAFWDRDLAEEATWQAVVLIPKRKGDYRGNINIFANQ